MSEGTLGRFERKSQAEPIKKFRRRKLLREVGKVVGDTIRKVASEEAAAVVAAAGIATAAVYSVAKFGHEVLGVHRTQEEYDQLLSRLDNEAVRGLTDISKIAKFRTSTNIEEKNPDGNVILWGSILKVNGEDVQGYDRFQLENAPIIIRHGGESWIPVIATINDLGIIRNTILFGNLSSTTEKAGAIVINRDSGARVVPLKNIPREQIGIVITPQRGK